jgi:ferric hydroxamate transport system ATP-binding protein
MAEASPSLFSLRGVFRRIGGRAILSDIALDAGGERMIGLVGPNGSGKSTLLRILAGQLRADEGTVTLGGRSVSSIPAREFARLVAFMPQFTPPAEGLTVRELVSLGRFPWHGTLGRFTAADRAKVEEALAATGTSGMAERLVDTLSGGERQRAWLAVMIAQDARCLLLDEPTSALDIAHQVEMLDLVRRLSTERRLSAVVVLHDVNMAARVCDEIVALREGRVFARGAPEAILEPNVLEGIYGIPMKILRADGVAVAHVA